MNGAATPQPVATVVIPVYNEAEGIRRCLAGVERQNLPLEVIVVDDGSTDDTVLAAERSGARVLQCGGRGAAAARNLGVRAARSDIVLFTDGDCIPCPGWARSLVEPIQNGVAIATKGTYRTRQGTATARFVQVEYEERYARMLGADAIDFLDTYSLCVRRDVLLAIGGFDEGFSGASVEDQEMSFRLGEQGRFHFVPQAVVDHQHAANPLSYLRKKLRIGRGKATIIRRHPRHLLGDAHTPRSLCVQVAAVITSGALWGGASLVPWCAFPALLLSLAPMALSLALVKRCRTRFGSSFVPVALGLSLGRAWALGLGFAAGLVVPSATLRSSPPEGRQTAATSGEFTAIEAREGAGEDVAVHTKG